MSLDGRVRRRIVAINSGAPASQYERQLMESMTLFRNAPDMLESAGRRLVECHLVRSRVLAGICQVPGDAVEAVVCETPTREAQRIAVALRLQDREIGLLRGLLLRLFDANHDRLGLALRGFDAEAAIADSDRGNKYPNMRHLGCLGEATELRLARAIDVEGLTPDGIPARGLEENNLWLDSLGTEVLFEILGCGNILADLCRDRPLVLSSRWVTRFRGRHVFAGGNRLTPLMGPYEFMIHRQ
jgi:hypothetical protein